MVPIKKKNFIFCDNSCPDGSMVKQALMSKCSLYTFLTLRNKIMFKKNRTWNYLKYQLLLDLLSSSKTTVHVIKSNSISFIVFLVSF